jgi:hypothetical protein
MTSSGIPSSIIAPLPFEMEGAVAHSFRHFNVALVESTTSGIDRAMDLAESARGMYIEPKHEDDKNDYTNENHESQNEAEKSINSRRFCQKEGDEGDNMLERNDDCGDNNEDKDEIEYMNDFKPAFFRPPPEPFIVSTLPLPTTTTTSVSLPSFEVKWSVSHDTSSFLWDTMMDLEDTNLVELRNLVKAAVTMPLIPKQQERINEILYDQPHFIHNCGITTKIIQPLVEYNPSVAIDCLIILLQSNHGLSYLTILNEMELSLCSIEVVNGLTNGINPPCLSNIGHNIPKDFIHIYIINCIAWCENTIDKSMQNRLVRVVCVFLQSLIRNSIIDNADIFIEIQAFCIGFSRIKEAVGLFQLIKIN